MARHSRRFPRLHHQPHRGVVALSREDAARARRIGGVPFAVLHLPTLLRNERRQATFVELDLGGTGRTGAARPCGERRQRNAPSRRFGKHGFGVAAFAGASSSPSSVTRPPCRTSSQFLRVTGADSRILGQVKEAWQAARNHHHLRTPLDRLFQQSFSVAKRVRTDTRIGAHPVSVAFAAVRMAQRLFTEMDRAAVMLIGAGDTIELAARHLSDAKVKRLLIANRTLEHAQVLASQHGGVALPLHDIDRHLYEADIIISATASREPILNKQMIQAALKARKHKPMFLLDLAVPRDIAADVAELPDVYLYTVDDLEQVIEDNRASRREAANEAEVIIDLQVQHFVAWSQAQGRQERVALAAHAG